MAITVTWDNESKTIIRYVYEGHWTITDFNLAYAESRTLLDEVDHTVHFIVDIRASHLLPNGALSRGRTIANSPHVNEGRTAIVGASPVIRAILDVFRRLHGKKFDETKFILVSGLDVARSKLLGDAN